MALTKSEIHFDNEMFLQLYATIASDSSAGISLSDLAFWLRPKEVQPSKDPAWAHLPETFISRSLGENAAGVIAALISATQRGVEEVSFGLVVHLVTLPSRDN